MKKVLLYVSFVTALVSCNNDKTAPRWEEKHNTREFGAVISMETYPVVVDEFMNIKEWCIVDTMLICKNGGGEPFIMCSTQMISGLPENSAVKETERMNGFLLT